LKGGILKLKVWLQWYFKIYRCSLWWKFWKVEMWQKVEILNSMNWMGYKARIGGVNFFNVNKVESSNF
jgi:hypothetical protein